MPDVEFVFAVQACRVKFPIQNGKSVLPGHMRIASSLEHFGQRKYE